MSEEKDNKWKCGCSKEPYQKSLAKAEDWEVKKKEKLKEILESDKAPNCFYVKGGSHSLYSTGGRGDTFLACPNGCGKMYKKVTEYGDELELEHECEVQLDNQIKSNQIKSNQIKSNQTVNNSSNSQKSYLPWILGGIGLVSLIGVGICFLTKNNKNND